MISVGIDISKESSTVCILKPYGEIVLAPKEFKHTDRELSELVKLIQSFQEDVKVVLEATGAYHLPVLTVLKEAELFVCVVNPLMMKKYASATMRKVKTDKMDSIKIANYGIDNWFKLKDHQPQGEIYDELRLLGRQYSHYITLKIRSKLSLANILDRTMPGIKQLIRGDIATNPTKDKLSDFAEKYWHYDNITNLTQDDFVADYCAWAKEKGYQANKTKAKAIHYTALDGVPTLSSSLKTTQLLIIEAVNTLKAIKQALKNILTQMQELAMSLPEYVIVRSMGGVGEILAPRLIAEIGDIRKFHSSKALIAYSGIDSPPHESGKFKGQGASISKRGSSLLRKTGYEIMTSVKVVKPVDDPAVYQFILKKEAEGKPKKVAKIAAFNKFLRIYYARICEVQKMD